MADPKEDDRSGSDPRVCLGAVAGAYGVRGEARLKTFTDEPESIGAYGPLCSEDGRRVFDVVVTRRLKGDMVAARLSGVPTKEAADALRGARLYVPRAALPAVEEADAFYHADLIGLRVEDPQGAPLGVVRAVHDFGAGDLIEYGAAGAKRTELAPFSREVVPKIDVAAGYLVLDAPAEAAEDTAPPKDHGADQSKADGDDRLGADAPSEG